MAVLRRLSFFLLFFLWGIVTKGYQFSSFQRRSTWNIINNLTLYIMEKSLKIDRKSNQMTMKISMSFDDYQDLRSFMNVVSKSKEWSIFNELWSDVPMRFREMLLTD